MQCISDCVGYLADELVTLEILIVPSEDFINLTGDFDFSSFSFEDEVARFTASGGTSPSGNSTVDSSPKIEHKLI